MHPGPADAVGGPLVTLFGVDETSVVYQAMPMFHSNALLAGISPALNGGTPIVLCRRFSGSGWLPDYGTTA